MVNKKLEDFVLWYIPFNDKAKHVPSVVTILNYKKHLRTVKKTS